MTSALRYCLRPEASLLRSSSSRKAVIFRPALISRPQPLLVDGPRLLQQQRAACIAHAKKGGGGGKSDAKASPAGGGGEETAQLMAKAKAEAEDRMKKCILAVQENFASIRTGRANPQILDRVVVEYFGTPTPLKQMAAVSVPDAFTLLISPFDKASLKEIEKALNESDIGLTPNNDGEKIRLGLPQLTQDRRKELVKGVSKMAEDGKIAVRNVRKDAMKKAEKLDLSKDGSKQLEDDIQKLTDVYIKKLDEVMKAKSEEVMRV